MNSSNQEKPDQTEQSIQKQGQDPSTSTTSNKQQPATSTHTLPSRPKNDNTMPKPSASTSSPMAPRSLPLHIRSQNNDTRKGRDSSLSQLDSVDLFAVGAWADPQMGGTGPDHALDEHLRSAGSGASRQSSGRK